MRKYLVGLSLLLLAVIALADEVKLTIDADVNRSAFVRPIFFDADTVMVESDTTAMAWWGAAKTDWDSTYSTGYTAAVAAEDSGGLELEWTAAEGTFDRYQLEIDTAGTDGVWANSWAIVDSNIAAGDTTYTHAADDPLAKPRRGGIRYRLYAFTAADSQSAVAISNGGDVFYNQAVGFKVVFHGIESFAEYDSGNVAVSTTETYIYTSPWVPLAPVAAFSSDSQAEDIAQNIATIGFTDGSSESPTSWNWDWGDSVDGGYTRGTTETPSHDYNVAGTYSPTLWATNAAGSDDTTRTDYIVISADTTPPDTSGGLWDVPGVEWGDTTGGGQTNAPVVLTFDMGGTPDELVSIWSEYMIEGESWVPADTSSGKGWSTPSSGTWVDTVFTGETVANVGSGTDLSSFRVTARDMATTPNTIAYAQRDIYLERQEEVDTTPPDTSGVFVSVTVDTASASNTILTLTDMTINEDGQVQFAWSNDSGSTYFTDADWNPGAASTTVGDTIHTGVDIDTFLGATGSLVDIYTRFRLRDDEGTPNVGGWNENQFEYARAADTTPPDTSGVFVSVTVDTTSASNTILTITDMTITGDASQVQFAWSNNSGSTYFTDADWNPASASVTVGDTIHTGVDIDTFAGSSASTVPIYTRFRLRDDEGTPNVSGWNENQFLYTREVPAGGDDYDAEYGYVYVHSDDATNIKVLLYDSSYNLLATSDGTAIGTPPGWVQCTFSSPPTLVAGTEYALAAVADGDWYPAMDGSAPTYSVAFDNGHSYASPPSVWEWIRGGGSDKVPSLYLANIGDDTLVGYDSVGSVTTEPCYEGEVMALEDNNLATCITF